MTINSKIENDKDEMKVLLEIRKNASNSIDQIAKKCGFSRQKVSRIIDNIIVKQKYGVTLLLLIMKK